jgi:beta-lactamase superfamily II metal-dependent hydrolase
MVTARIFGAKGTQMLISIARLVVLLSLPATAANNLRIYFVDVESGASTLIVSPSGESLLADTGNALPDDRDAKRIYAATRQAGLKKIDYLVTTHFDGDHSGVVAALVKTIPIANFYDHGDTTEAEKPRDVERWNAYKAGRSDWEAGVGESRRSDSAARRQGGCGEFQWRCAGESHQRRRAQSALSGLAAEGSR